jgi:glucose-1-phosphate adenylyltransferase
MSKDVLAMVLVGGRGTRLGAITKHTAKPAVTFGGKYKLIDFVLSNLSNSLINTVGIITQYEPHELMRYIQRGASWDLDVVDGGIHFLTPYTSYDGEKWQKGTAHAIKQHFHFIKEYKPKYVLILSGDHVYKMDYRNMIKAHEASQANITIAAFKPHDDLSRYGVLSMDESNRITAFNEKPESPKSDLASMGIYVFNTDILEDMLLKKDDIDFDFGKDIIPKALGLDYHLNAYIFDGYFRDVGTIESLYEANMDIIDHPEYLELHDYKAFPLFTKSQDLPPHHNQSMDAVKNSLVSDGVLIKGSINHSIISSNVLIKPFASVNDSIIFSGVKIGEHAQIKNCIILENTVVLPHTKLLFDEIKVIDNDVLWHLGVAHE